MDLVFVVDRVTYYFRIHSHCSINSFLWSAEKKIMAPGVQERTIMPLWWAFFVCVFPLHVVIFLKTHSSTSNTFNTTQLQDLYLGPAFLCTSCHFIYSSRTHDEEICGWRTPSIRSFFWLLNGTKEEQNVLFAPFFSFLISSRQINRCIYKSISGSANLF